jgi:AraC-like DNA-binding protein
MRHIVALPLSEAAIASAFADQPHMSRTMKRVTGLSPRRLKESLASEAGCGDRLDAPPSAMGESCD